MAVNFYGGTALTGGGTGALDAIDGADLNDKDGAFVITSAGVYMYILDADSAAAEDSPDVIQPDANAGDKRWIRVSMYGTVVSDPQSGQYRLKGLRLDSSKKMVVTYDGDAEP